ncbi:MAG: ATP-binding protein [Bacteroidota bacterium]
MEFQEIHKAFFNCSLGAYSEVTSTENKNSQVTADKDEKTILLNYFGKNNLLIGNVQSNPSKASKEFLLYPHFETITLNLAFVKLTSELRLYLSSDHGFKPKGNDISFIYINKEKKLVIGSMSKTEWEEIGMRFNFQPRARLLLQLGDQLIRNETIALTELVKNSFDADAGYCKVYMINVDNKDVGEIILEDDGWGMDIETIKNAWLEPGSDSKEKIVREKLYSPKGRLPIGEKGIGRFGVHKLGREIELITRKANNKEIVVRINWENFKEHKYLKDAPVIIFERIPEIFTKDKTGTKIIIKKLPIAWTRGKLRDAFRAINAISVPTTYHIDEIEKENTKVKDPNGFEALPDTNLGWIEDIPKWQDILQYALFFFDVEILDDKITKFKYQFRPWDNMKEITGNEVTEKIKPVNGLLDIEVSNSRKFKPLTVPEDVKIGKIRFQGCIFIRDKNILKIALNKPSFLSDYLNDNGGIRVFRNGLRVYDYGEKGNDWLNLDYRRFNDPGVKVSNNMILASITIDREESSSLVEKTNREGFIENEAYEIFKSQILYALRLVEICRKPDKERLDPIYRPKVETESVLKSIYNLKGFIDERVKDQETNKHLKLYVDKVEVNYKFMYDKLVKSANAGMGWSIYLHEIEKIIKEIEKVVKIGKEDERAIKLVNHLAKLIENYSQILRKSGRTNENLKTVIEQSLFNVEFRFKAHQVLIIDAFSESLLDDKVKLSRNLIVSTLMNIYDNSIYWLDRAGRETKKIRVALSDEKEGFISIVISDNGTGFLMSPEQMTEIMMSARGGMGMGLHLAKEIMEAHNNSVLSFNEYGEFIVPDEFKEGATLALCFKI